MKISVKNILDRIPGTTDIIDVIFPQRLFEHMLGDNWFVLDDIHAQFEAMKVPEGILGKFREVKVHFRRPCDGCGTLIDEHVEGLETGWRSFVWKKEDEYIGEELEDVFLIDKTEGSVILDECLRQEILLFLPPLEVCHACEKLADEQERGDADHNPFKDLKSLMKE